MATFDITVPAGTNVGGTGSGAASFTAPPGDFDGATIDSVLIFGSATLSSSQPTDDTIGIRWRIQTDGGVATWGDYGSVSVAACFGELGAFESSDGIENGSAPIPAPSIAVTANWDEIAYQANYIANMMSDAETVSWSAFTIRVTYTPTGGGGSVTADPGALALTGAVAVLGVTMVAEPGALALSGAEATLTATDNKVLQAEPGALILTGATADLIADVDVTLVADPGALALSGAVATLIGTDNKVLQAEPGVLLLTGATADLLVSDNVILVADPSQLTLTGAAATLTASDAPVLVARRGGVRFIREPEPETRAKKLIELKALVKSQAAPDTADGTITQKMALVVPKSKQRRVERLLAETGITLDELLIILS